MALNKKKGKLLTTTAVGDAQLIPPKWKASLGTTITEQAVPLDITVDATTTTLVESVVKQEQTEERKKTNVTIGDPTGQTLTEYVKASDGSLGTRTLSLVASNAAAPTVSATTDELNRQNFGNGLAEQAVTTVATLFNRQKKDETGEGELVYQAIRPFIQNLAVETVSVVSAGTTPTPATLATNGLGIITSEAARVDATKVLNVATTVTGTKVALAGVELDEETGTVTAVTREIVAAGTAGSNMGADGTYSIVTPINAAWSIKTTRKATAGISRTYYTDEMVNSLPRVLVAFNTFIYTRKAYKFPYGNSPDCDDPDYIHAAGSIAQAGFDIRLKDYNGVYTVTTVESWSQAAPGSGTLTATKFRPDGFSWVTPFNSGSVPECLHAGITIYASTGTTHPTLSYTVGDISVSATSPAAMPGTVVLADTVVPYKGGFLRRIKTIST